MISYKIALWLLLLAVCAHAAFRVSVGRPGSLDAGTVALNATTSVQIIGAEKFSPAETRQSIVLRDGNILIVYSNRLACLYKNLEPIDSASYKGLAGPWALKTSDALTFFGFDLVTRGATSGNLTFYQGSDPVYQYRLEDFKTSNGVVAEGDYYQGLLFFVVDSYDHAELTVVENNKKFVISRAFYFGLTIPLVFSGTGQDTEGTKAASNSPLFAPVVTETSFFITPAPTSRLGYFDYNDWRNIVLLAIEATLLVVGVAMLLFAVTMLCT